MRWFLIFVLLTVLTGTTASAQSDEQLWDRCTNQDKQPSSDLAIGGCTALIQSGSLNDEHLAIAFSNRGSAYSKKGESDRAIADYNQAIRLDPGYAYAFYNRGSAYADKGEYDRAIADYDQAIRLDPGFTYAFYNRGSAYADKGDYDRAIADHDQVIRLDPGDEYAFNGRGAAYTNKGEYDRAIADYNQAIRLDPGYAYAFYNRGNAYRNKGEYDRAIADYDQAIRLDPGYADAFYNRGLAYYHKGESDRAIANFDQSIALQETDTARANRANAVGWESATGRKRNARMALRYARQAVRLAPDKAYIQDTLAAALTADRQSDAALAAYEKVMRMDPSLFENIRPS
jgi:tetratricopeptide (TPR) repeat protein